LFAVVGAEDKALAAETAIQRCALGVDAELAVAVAGFAEIGEVNRGGGVGEAGR
jgi:hypothetical protein